ncbi:MAG: periplasmic heavy metal sensor [Acidobacteria bacterium]|nr:periplasmic heavy metal sensor [Acidobacteriota bacterium]
MNACRAIGIVLAAALLSAGFTAAQELEDPNDQWWTQPRLAERLGLTREQVQAIEKRAFASGDRLIELRAEMEKGRLELVRLLRAEQLEDGQLQAAVNRIVETECAMSRERTMARLDIARLLTRDQRMQLMRLSEKRGPAPRRPRLR